MNSILTVVDGHERNETRVSSRLLWLQNHLLLLLPLRTHPLLGIQILHSSVASTNHFLVSFMTAGPTEDEDNSCSVDTIFDWNLYLHVEDATKSLQVVAQERGELVDASNWSCYSFE
jgi:hypothetical protein